MVSSHYSLFEYVKTNFLLQYHYHYSLAELEGMMPWELDVYISLLIQQRKEEENKKRNQLNG